MVFFLGGWGLGVGGYFRGEGVEGGGAWSVLFSIPHVVVAGSISTVFICVPRMPMFVQRKNNVDIIYTLHYMNFQFTPAYELQDTTKKFQVIEQKWRNGRMMTPGLFTEQRQTESNFVITFPPSASAKCNKGLSKACNYIGNGYVGMKCRYFIYGKTNK